MIHECSQNTKKLEVSYDSNGAEVWIEYEGCCTNVDIDLSVNYCPFCGIRLTKEKL